MAGSGHVHALLVIFRIGNSASFPSIRRKNSPTFVSLPSSFPIEYITASSIQYLPRMIRMIRNYCNTSTSLDLGVSGIDFWQPEASTLA